MWGNFGVRILYSDSATSRGRTRTYAKRRAKSARHWRRMDKKYLKRYGYNMVPDAYQLGDTLIVHPALKAQIEATFKEVSARSALDNWL